MRITSPSTSSATAAPSTVRASTVASARRSLNTRAVMPTLVAASAAPMNSDWLLLWPSALATAYPPTIGTTTPITATDIDARPTAPSSPRSISIPTPSSRRITPSSPSTFSVSSPPTRFRTDGPMIAPATISATTAGTLMRSASSAASLAATRTMRMSSRTAVTSIRCPSGRAGGLERLEEVPARPHRPHLEPERGDAATQPQHVDVERVAGGAAPGHARRTSVSRPTTALYRSMSAAASARSTGERVTHRPR